MTKNGRTKPPEKPKPLEGMMFFIPAEAPDLAISTIMVGPKAYSAEETAQRTQKFLEAGITLRPVSLSLYPSLAASGDFILRSISSRPNSIVYAVQGENDIAKLARAGAVLTPCSLTKQSQPGSLTAQPDSGKILQR